jgi:nucleoside-diphosphate-sugar epimerase
MAKISKINNFKTRSKIKKILITGSEGFIGSAIVKLFRKKKNYVVFGIGKKKRVIKSYKYFSLNLLNKKKTKKFLQKYKFDIVIHAAWITDTKTMRHSKLNCQWYKSSINIVDAIKSQNPKIKFICIGSSDEYFRKKGENNILYEDSSKIYNTNQYAKYKILLLKYLKKIKIDYIWFRVFWLFGEKENSKRFFPSLIKAIINDRTFTINRPKIFLDYSYIGDAAKMIEKIIFLKKNNKEKIFNICSGKTINLYKIASKIQKIIGKKELLLTSKNNDGTSILGSNIKLKKYKCYFRSDLEKNIRKYVKLHF